MTKRIEINKPILREEFSFEYCSTKYKEFFIKTEVVISKPEICVPIVARVYYTDLYYGFGEDSNSIKTYNEIRVENGGKCVPISELKRIFVIEIFHDIGEDGHIDYEHIGYAYVLESEIHSYPYELMDKLAYELRYTVVDT